MPSTNVVGFPGKSRQMTMREAYAEGLLANAGTYDHLTKESVYVMVGFFTGAAVAFHALGDGSAAASCEECARNIIDDWENFRQHIATARVRLLAPA